MASENKKKTRPCLSALRTKDIFTCEGGRKQRLGACRSGMTKALTLLLFLDQAIQAFLKHLLFARVHTSTYHAYNRRGVFCYISLMSVSNVAYLLPHTAYVMVGGLVFIFYKTPLLLCLVCLRARHHS